MSNNIKEPEKLEKAHCEEDTEVQSREHHDHTIDGVTYRVWSAFLGKTNAETSIAELMLRDLNRNDEEATGLYEDQTAEYFETGADGLKMTV